MSLNSPIEWTEATWNPTRGCSRVSPGCVCCYAERDAARKNANPKLPKYQGFAIFDQHHKPHWTGKVELIPEALGIPRKRRAPTTWFVNSMSDLYHPKLSREALLRVYRVMYETPRHTYQILTKHGPDEEEKQDGASMKERLWEILHELGPMPAHIWHGVSVENTDYRYRLDVLMSCPVPKRFLSAEPLLSELDLKPWLRIPRDQFDSPLAAPISGLDWVIVGGESGPGARPMHPAWARKIRDDCQAAGVPFFFKQWGGFRPVGCADIDSTDWDETATMEANEDRTVRVWQDGSVDDGNERPKARGAWLMEPVGKKAAGRLLDGREWSEMPLSSPPRNQQETTEQHTGSPAR